MLTGFVGKKTTRALVHCGPSPTFYVKMLVRRPRFDIDLAFDLDAVAFLRRCPTTHCTTWKAGSPAPRSSFWMCPVVDVVLQLLAVAPLETCCHDA